MRLRVPLLGSGGHPRSHFPTDSIISSHETGHSSFRSTTLPKQSLTPKIQGKCIRLRISEQAGLLAASFRTGTPSEGGKGYQKTSDVEGAPWRETHQAPPVLNVCAFLNEGMQLHGAGQAGGSADGR